MNKLLPTSGFTLVEALVSLAILTVALIPAFQQATSAIILSGAIRNSLIASNLAQEGVEVVRAMRDENWFNGQPFDTGLTGAPASCDLGCLVQFNSSTPLALSGNPALKLNTDSGLYQYDTGSDTNFHRKITITKPSSHELKVISQITWQERSGQKTFAVEYHLFDWLQ